MKGMILGFVLTAMGVVPVACAQEISAAAGKAPLTLTISAPQTITADTAGNAISFHAVLTNVSNDPINISGGAPYTVLIRDENGNEVRPKPGIYGFWGSGGSGLNLIEPGHSVHESFSLGEGYELKPGRYVVRSQRYWDDSKGAVLVLQSNEITITVLPKEGGQQSSKNAVGEIRITSQNITVVAGDPVYTSMQLENTSDHPIESTEAQMGGIDHRYSFHIVTEDGALLESVVPKLEIGSIRVLTMQPGEKEDISYCVSCRYHGLLAAGKYRLFATRVLQDGAIATTVTSNEITVTVVPKLGEQPPPFSLTISAAPVFKAGEPLVIHISLTNLSDHPLDTPHAWMGNFDAVYAFDIRDSAGTQLAAHAPPDVTYLIGMSGTLDPGKTKVQDQGIQDFYDVNKPGTYEIRVNRCIDLENPEGNGAPKYDESKGVVWSNTITVTVVPATATTPR